MKISTLFIGILSLAFVACDSSDSNNEVIVNQEPRNSSSLENPVKTNPFGTLKTEVSRKTSLLKDLSNIEEFKENINSYEVKFEAISGQFIGTFAECRRNGFDGNRETFSGSFDAEGKAAVVEITMAESDSTVTDYECNISDGEMVFFGNPIRLKKSFIVSGEKNYFEFIGSSDIETLLIEEDSKLNTNGSIVELRVNELISLNGKIVTFSEDKLNSTRENYPGASGGQITLNANSAMGNLDIELRGLNGGKVTKVPAKIAQVPPRDPTTNGCNLINSAADCSGKQGPQGYRGTDGYQGSVGGNSGLIKLSIKNSNKFTFSIKYLPGQGSEGGVGGEGGQGGPGGLGGEVVFREHQMSPSRTRFPDGIQGIQGPQGTTGARGNDGRNDKSEIDIESDNYKNIIESDLTL